MLVCVLQMRLITLARAGVNYSGKQTIRSLFSLHNETGNIWSHFIGELHCWVQPVNPLVQGNL